MAAENSHTDTVNLLIDKGAKYVVNGDVHMWHFACVEAK